MIFCFTQNIKTKHSISSGFFLVHVTYIFKEFMNLRFLLK